MKIIKKQESHSRVKKINIKITVISKQRIILNIYLNNKKNKKTTNITAMLFSLLLSYC